MIVKYNYSAEPDSTSIEGLYYDSTSRRLAVKFVNGNWAGYANVPGYMYSNLVSASSVGSYYNSAIRGKYIGFKVDGVEDVNAVPVEPVKEESAGKFRVVAEITGPATLDVYATDIADALAKAEEQINKAFKGDVKIVFKGVNLV